MSLLRCLKQAHKRPIIRVGFGIPLLYQRLRTGYAQLVAYHTMGGMSTQSGVSVVRARLSWYTVVTVRSAQSHGHGSLVPARHRPSVASATCDTPHFWSELCGIRGFGWAHGHPYPIPSSLAPNTLGVSVQHSVQRPVYCYVLLCTVAQRTVQQVVEHLVHTFAVHFAPFWARFAYRGEQDSQTDRAILGSLAGKY